MAERSLYEILMLHPTATADVINAVYRALAKQYHPDHAGAAGVEKMAQLNEAYAILKDEQKRARYDAILNATLDDGAGSVMAHGNRSSGSSGSSADQRTAASSPDHSTTAWSMTGARQFNRESMPGATNLKFEGGSWSVRPPSEPAPPPSEYGEAGAPPSYVPSRGTVISFGRYRGWTISQVAAYDRNYVEWLSRTMAGRAYRAEVTAALGQAH